MIPVLLQTFKEIIEILKEAYEAVAIPLTLSAFVMSQGLVCAKKHNWEIVVEPVVSFHHLGNLNANEQLVNNTPITRFLLLGHNTSLPPVLHHCVAQNSKVYQHFFHFFN